MKYRFYLYHADQGKYIRIKDPVGWNSLGKTIRRDMTWHGIFFDYAPKLKFVKDGKAFIQFYYEKYGIETTILLRIEKQDPLTRKFETDYIGRLNLTKYKISTIYVECNVESDSSILQTIKNKDSVKVALSGLTSIPMHSKIIPKKYERKTDVPVADVPVAQGVPFVTGKNYLIFSTDDAVTDEIGGREPYVTQASSEEPVAAHKYLFKVPEAGDYTFERIRPIFYCNTSGSITWTVKWYLVTGRAGNYTTTQIGSTISVTSTEVTGEPLLANHTVTLKAEDEIYVFGEVDVSIGGSNFTYLPYNFLLSAPYEAELKINSLTVAPASTANVGLKYENFTQVLEGITGKADLFRSSYYGRTENGYGSDGAGSLRGNTNGLQLRGINKPVHLTLKELITTAQAIDGLGFGIIKSAGVERLYAEPLTFWYQAKRLMRLDYVKDIEKEVMEELYYNELEAGPDKWSTTAGNVAHLDEPNAPKQLTLPITQLKKKLMLKSPYITGGYPLEFTRRENKEPSKNSELDNNIFEIELRRNSGFEPAKDQLFSSVTGVLSPSTSYNLILSPARCIRRNGRLIRSFLEKQKDQTITFSFGEANSAMFSKLTSEAVGITENANILISDLESPLFLAEAYSIKAKLTRQQLIDLNTTDPAAAANVWQFVEFSTSNKNYKRGYVLQARPSPDSNECEMILLRANA